MAAELVGLRVVVHYEGNIQALVFFLAALSGFVATLVASTIVNAGMKGGDTTPGEGLEALRHTNYGRALARSIRYWWKEWRTQTRSYSSSAAHAHRPLAA